MEINNLLPQTQKTSTDTKKFFAIEINTESVKTATWEIAGIKPNLLNVGTIEEYSANNTEELITAVDTSLGKASVDIEPEPDQVVFSLPESWVKGSSIATDKKSLLKQLTEKLDLKPIGFVVTIEAIAHYLKTKQGGPFTGILVGVNDQEVKVTIVQNSSIVGSNTVGRSSDLGADVQEGLARFPDIDSLPANMILYNGHTDLENEKQQLISYEWQEKLPFLHIPKINSFSPDESIKAVVAAGGAEIIQSASPPPETQDQESPATTPVSKDTPKQEIPDMAEEFGFSEKFDKPSQDSSVHKPPDDKLESNVHQPLAAGDKGLSRKSKLPRLSLPLGILFKKLRPPRFSLPSNRAKSPPTLIVGIIFLFILTIGLISAYWFLPSATVTIYVSPKIIQREITFSVDPSLNEPDIDSATLPGRLADTEVNGEAQITVTGEKLVGDQAAGEVTIFNRTDSVKTFASGTRLTGPDSLTYTIDQEVKLASASSKENPDFSVTIEPAKANSNIIASTIGAEFNLGKGTEFTVANLAKSSFVAKAVTDISGGTSRQITAVSDQDQQTLRDQLSRELQDKVADQFNQSPEDFIGAIILDSEETQLVEEFSKQVGDEAEQLSLSATLTALTLTYSKSDLALIIEKDILDSIPDNYSFQRDQSSIEVVETQTDDNSVTTVVAKTNAKVIPLLDKNEIVRAIRGRYPEVTQNYFTSLPNFAKVAIDIRPKLLPTRLKTFPRVMGKITIEVKVESEESN